VKKSILEDPKEKENHQITLMTSELIFQSLKESLTKKSLLTGLARLDKSMNTRGCQKTRRSSWLFLNYENMHLMVDHSVRQKSQKPQR